MKNILVFFAIFLAPPVLLAKSYTFSVVPQQSIITLYESWQPFVKYLRMTTGLDIKLSLKKSMQDFEMDLKKSEFDIIYMNPLQYIKMHDSNGYIPLVRENLDIQGILVTNQNTEKTGINEKSTFIFPAENAFAATILIKKELLQKFDVDLEKHQNYMYVNSHESVYLGITKGFAKFGGGVMRTLNSYHDNKKNGKLKVLHTTKAYPSHPIAVKPSVTLADQKKLQDAMLEIPQDILDQMHIKKMVRVTNNEYDSVRKLTE